DTGDRLLRKASEGVGHGANQPIIDIHGAAAHAGDDTGIREWTTFESGQNQVAPRANHVLEHTEDIDAEFLDVRAVEDRATDSHHARSNLRDRHLIGCAPYGLDDRIRSQKKSDKGSGQYRGEAAR